MLFSSNLNFTFFPFGKKLTVEMNYERDSRKDVYTTYSLEEAFVACLFFDESLKAHSKRPEELSQEEVDKRLKENRFFAFNEKKRNKICMCEEENGYSIGTFVNAEYIVLYNPIEYQYASRIALERCNDLLLVENLYIDLYKHKYDSKKFMDSMKLLFMTGYAESKRVQEESKGKQLK